MPDEPPISQRRARTRERLVGAATTVVAEHGFHAASVDRIAEAAGLSIGALYSNFKGKDDVLFAVFDQHVQWFEEQLRTRVERDGPTGWTQFAAEDDEQFLVFIEFWAYAVRKPPVRAQFAVRMAKMRADVADVLAAQPALASASGAIPVDVIALLGLAVVRGLALEQLVDPDAVPHETLARLLGLLGGAQ